MGNNIYPSRTPQAYSPVGFLSDHAGKLVLNSFSGADITCSIVVPRPRWVQLKAKTQDPKAVDLPTLRVFAEIETLSISSARDVFPVRRLGESHVHAYTRGSRTIAGTMVFTTMSRDVFAEFYHYSEMDSLQAENAPMHVDQMPPFHILITAHSEYGTIASAALLNVTLTNWGTTLSIHDLKVESTYSYVAQHFLPFVQDYSGFQAAIARLTSTSNVPNLSSTAGSEIVGVQVDPKTPVESHAAAREDDWMTVFLEGLSDVDALFRGSRQRPWADNRSPDVYGM